MLSRGAVLGLIFIAHAVLFGAVHLFVAVAMREAAWSWHDRVVILLVMAVLLVMSFFCYMPDDFLDTSTPVINMWAYGPGRRFFGMCGMVATSLYLLCDVIDIIRRPRGKRGEGAGIVP